MAETVESAGEGARRKEAEVPKMLSDACAHPPHAYIDARACARTHTHTH